MKKKPKPPTMSLAGPQINSAPFTASVIVHYNRGTKLPKKDWILPNESGLYQLGNKSVFVSIISSVTGVLPEPELVFDSMKLVGDGETTRLFFPRNSTCVVRNVTLHDTTMHHYYPLALPRNGPMPIDKFRARVRVTSYYNMEKIVRFQIAPFVRRDYNMFEYFEIIRLAGYGHLVYGFPSYVRRIHSRALQWRILKAESDLIVHITNATPKMWKFSGNKLRKGCSRMHIPLGAPETFIEKYVCKRGYIAVFEGFEEYAIRIHKGAMNAYIQYEGLYLSLDKMCPLLRLHLETHYSIRGLQTWSQVRQAASKIMPNVRDEILRDRRQEHKPVRAILQELFPGVDPVQQRILDCLL